MGVQEDKKAVQQAIQNTEPDLVQLSESCRDFVRQCLCKDARQRPSAAQLQLHPWLRPYSTPSFAQSYASQPAPRPSPHGIQTVLAPRRPPTPPTPVSGALPSSSECMLMQHGAVATRVPVPIATPGLTIAALQSQYRDSTSSHCKHASVHAPDDGAGSPMSTMQTYGSSPDVSGPLSGMHASIGHDNSNFESVAMGSYASSTCITSMLGPTCNHMGAPMDTRVAQTIAPQSSDTSMHGMHAHDSKSSLSREASVLDSAFNTLSQTVLPPLHTTNASVFAPVAP